MLAEFEDLEIALGEIVHRIVVPVSGHDVQHHLAAGDMKDHRGLWLSGRRRLLRSHRKTQR
jgi:hypothetical protein